MIDQRITKILKKETVRQENTIELIASENFASQAVMDLAGSVFTDTSSTQTVTVSVLSIGSVIYLVDSPY